jgi:hypothetical protein
MIGVNILFIFLVTYIVSRLTDLSGMLKYTLIGAMSYLLASKLGGFASFTLPIVETVGMLNPLLILFPIFENVVDHSIMPYIVDEL